MKLQLIHRESGEVLFDGGDPVKDNEAWKLATQQDVIAVFKPDTDEELTPKDYRPEGAYAALFVWLCIGLIGLGAASGFAFYLFKITSGI
jgi:hypothetical protein